MEVVHRCAVVPNITKPHGKATKIYLILLNCPLYMVKQLFGGTGL
jgi:hypothetical protein